MPDQEQLIEGAIEKIRTALDRNQVDEAVAILMNFHPVDRADIFNELSDDERDLLLTRLDTASTADLLEEMEDEEAVDTVEDMPAARLADLLDEMEPDEAADLLGNLSPEQASQVLAEMEDADEVIPLLGYPEETAGGRMTTSYLALKPRTTAEQAIQFLREVHPSVEVPYYLFVISREKALVGVVGLRELVTVSPETMVETIMNPEVIYVGADTDQEEVANLMSKYNLAALPVVNDERHLLGVVTRDDVMEVLEDETTEDILHMGAIETGPLVDKPYWSQRIVDMVRSRFFWLLSLFVAETLTGTVLRHYEGELKAVVSLSFFVPLLIGTGGNAGSQTVSTVIRALALKEIRTADAVRVLWREARTGIFLGLLVGLVAFGRSLLWGVGINLAITVAVTVLAICTWATTVASLIPILAARVGIDPTVVSAPLMATLIDATGLVIYFSLAAMILPQL